MLPDFFFLAAELKMPSNDPTKSLDLYKIIFLLKASNPSSGLFPVHASASSGSFPETLALKHR